MSELDMNWELLANKDYAFLTESPLLGNNILLLTLGGSHAYGTNVETSDIDVRGITYNPVDSLLGNRVFEQYEDEATDTVVYGLNKMLDAFGIVLHSLSDNPEFGNSTVMLMMYNNGRITIEIVDAKEDDCEIIDPTYTQEEYREIEEYLKLE